MSDDCPCKEVVIMKNEIDMKLQSFEMHLCQHSKDIQGHGDKIEKCLKEMQEASTKFALGAKRFEGIESKNKWHFRKLWIAVALCGAVVIVPPEYRAVAIRFIFL